MTIESREESIEATREPEHTEPTLPLEFAGGGMPEGLVLRAISGQYIVQPVTGMLTTEATVRCLLRGNLKKDFTYNTSTSVGRRVTRAKRPMIKDTVAVGDHVRFSLTEDGSGIIEEILPRLTRFARASFRGRCRPSSPTLISSPSCSPAPNRIPICGA